MADPGGGGGVQRARTKKAGQKGGFVRALRPPPLDPPLYRSIIIFNPQAWAMCTCDYAELVQLLHTTPLRMH